MFCIQIAEIIVFYLLSLSVIYLFVFAIGSKFYHRKKYSISTKTNKFAVLFPAYKEDNVIIESVRSFLKQSYPSESYEIIVISDHMQTSTNAQLAKLPIRLIIANYEKSSKAKAMQLAMDNIIDKEYNMIVIMDADNITDSNFLHTINQVHNTGICAIQAHRKAKNTNTHIAILDAISEEINNGIFRKGHVALGFSSALIGSGMAFEAKWFKKNVYFLESAGEDKELETLLLKDNIFIEYLNDLYVYDEKIQQEEGFKNQRKRWLSAQFNSLLTAIPYFPKAFLKRNFDYCNKVIQWMMLPRIILLLLISNIALASTIINLESSIKWWGLLFLLLLTLCLMIPIRLYNYQLLKAITKLPVLAWIMLTNFFHLRNTNKNFIHTKHG